MKNVRTASSATGPWILSTFKIVSRDCGREKLLFKRTKSAASGNCCVESVICNSLETKTSRSSGRPVATGYVPDGRLVIVVYEQIDESTVCPVSAYEIGN